MQNTWKSKMIDKIADSVPDVSQKFLDIVERAGPLAQSVIRDTMEMTVFPWYEAHTNTKLSNKHMREAVAERIHQSLVDVIFIPKEDSREWSMDFVAGDVDSNGDPIDIEGEKEYGSSLMASRKYSVMAVIPAYKGDAEYDIVLVLAPLDNQNDRIQCNLGTLLCNFVPIKKLEFRDYDA